MAVEDAITVDPVGDFALKGISRSLAAYNLVAAKFAQSVSATTMWRDRSAASLTQPLVMSVIAYIGHQATSPINQRMTPTRGPRRGRGVPSFSSQRRLAATVCTHHWWCGNIAPHDKVQTGEIRS